MGVLGLWATNTFGEDTGSDAVWTRGVKRRRDLSGTGRPVNSLGIAADESLHAKMDHRPIRAELNFEAAIERSTRSEARPATVLPMSSIQDDKIRMGFQKVVACG